MLQLYALLKPMYRTPGFDVIALDGINDQDAIMIHDKMFDANSLENCSFNVVNDAGESVHFRGSDVVYVSIKKRGI